MLLGMDPAEVNYIFNKSNVNVDKKVFLSMVSTENTKNRKIVIQNIANLIPLTLVAEFISVRV